MEEIDFDHLGKKTENFSGADLKAVVDVAVERKLQEALKTGIPKAAHDERPCCGRRHVEADDEGMVRHGAQLRALLEPGRNLRRHFAAFEALNRMNQNLERAILLFQQSRNDLAEAELRQALAAEPQDAYAHALLALCLAHREAISGGDDEARQAIHLCAGFFLRALRSRPGAD